MRTNLKRNVKLGVNFKVWLQSEGTVRGKELSHVYVRYGYDVIH